jgi:hypothetical protein
MAQRPVELGVDDSLPESAAQCLDAKSVRALGELELGQSAKARGRAIVAIATKGLTSVELLPALRQSFLCSIPDTRISLNYEKPLLDCRYYRRDQCRGSRSNAARRFTPRIGPALRGYQAIAE